MAKLIDFVKYKQPATLAAMPKVFDRNNLFPLDSTSWYETYEAAKKYSLESPIAYIGQIVYVADKDALYRLTEANDTYPDGLVEIAGNAGDFVKKEELTKTLSDFITKEAKESDPDATGVGVLVKDEEEGSITTRKLSLSDFVKHEDETETLAVVADEEGKVTRRQLTLKDFVKPEEAAETVVVVADENGGLTTRQLSLSDFISKEEEESLEDGPISFIKETDGETGDTKIIINNLSLSDFIKPKAEDKDKVITVDVDGDNAIYRLEYCHVKWDEGFSE